MLTADDASRRCGPRHERVKVCSVPGCPELQDESRCPTHRREAETKRGSREQRGYGAEHKALRARWAPLVATGSVKCWRCQLPIPADAAWHLGHDDNDRGKYRGPECVPCNTGTAARR